MPKPLINFVKAIDWINYYVGRFAMMLLFVMMGVLLWSSFSKAFLTPSLWTLEVAQFLMIGYFVLGGPYAMQMGSDVRMDLFYGNWSTKTKAAVDSVTIFALIFYLAVLLNGGLKSTQYALRYNETSATAWAPPMAPIKIIICVAVTLMLLQAIASWFRHIATLRGVEIKTLAEIYGQEE
ncbi:MAG: TRAP transporter small permease subunit [Chloroflexota bacterium]